MMKLSGIKKALIVCLSVLSIGACGGRNAIHPYHDKQPRLLLEDFFQGQLVADGIVKNRSGEVIRYFTASIDASWDENGIGQLDEQFIFDDGEQQGRQWRLEPLGEGRYRASANDVVPTESVYLAGNALQLVYRLTLPYRGRDIAVTVDDRMFLVKPGLVINESTLSKFGIHLASITLVIRQLDI